MKATLARILHRVQELFQNIMNALETMALLPSLFRDSVRRRRSLFRGTWRSRRSLDDLTQEIDHLFTAPLGVQNMLAMSENIREQLRQGLRSSPECMLPSYNHSLPTGQEEGTY